MVQAVAPKPVNVLVSSDFATVADRRGSSGSASAEHCPARPGPVFLQAAREIAGQGTFTSLAGAVPSAELNGSFARDA